jgi:very-short-patch-repair endonuclease
MMPSEASILSHWVIRFWNNQVENDINGVILAIEFALNDE